ncbi:VWA domain-containing protein [Amycolatopsis sp. H20-H5]|uniref:VWA domain-containing protein n=1 Tax=Amycolatopsis sp. H20-H5 TaxID=3046309 RepID=UPI002DB5F895|nr:VWA domain-containing protein [Amycolatopsis sp. H20-H5]MEC3982648.1 VWA domain-containing protein [Amycolatopsis sp. H20-H5]
MSGEPGLGLQVFQNKFLAEGDRTMNAIVKVTSAGGRERSDGVAAEVLLVDCSTSMRSPATKIAEARRAAIAAVDALPDGVLFAIVRGTHQAELVYPAENTLVTASDRTRAEAGSAIRHLSAVGGTALGSWLAKARELFDTSSAEIRHVVLLTDGRNEHQTREELVSELNACEGRFVCDARGIGDGWEPDELALIVKVLRGNVDSAVKDGQLAVDFRALIDAAMTKLLPEVRLRVGTMPFSTLRFVKVVHPNEYDLTDRLRPAGDHEQELLLGSFSGAESRDYHLCFDLTADVEPSYGQDRQLGWVELAPMAGARVPESPSGVLGRWTHDQVPPTLVDPKVLQYTIQAELGEALTAGGEAFAAGNGEGARRQWGLAVKLATARKNDDILTRLNRVVDVVDASTGEVRLRTKVPRSEVLHLLVAPYSRLSVTGDGEPPSSGGAEADLPPRTCAACDTLSPGGARFCVGCRAEFARSVS